MKTVCKYLLDKRYLILILAAAIIGQCYLQLMLPEYMGKIQNIVKSADAINFMNDIRINGGWMALISAGVLCLACIQIYCASSVSAYLGKQLRTNLFTKVNSISFTDYNKFGTATLITRTTNDCEQIKNFTLMSLRILIMSPTMMIIAIIKTAQVRPNLLLVLCVILPIILIGIIILLYVATPYFKKIQEKVDNVTVVLRENLTGIRVIRAYDQEVTEQNKFDVANKDLTKTTITVNRIMSIANPFINVLFNLCYVGIYAFGFYIMQSISGTVLTDVAIEVSSLITDITVVASYSSQIMMSFIMFAMVFVMMPQALASVNRINEILNVDTNKTKNDTTKSDPHYKEYEEYINQLYKEEFALEQPIIEEYERNFAKSFNLQLLKFKESTLTNEECKKNKELKFLHEYEKINKEYHLKRKKAREKYSGHISESSDKIVHKHLKDTSIRGVIEFKDVSFAYPDSKVNVLENISFKTEAGKTTAIIGSTGCGKSTLINLIPKFYSPTSGQILFDGVDISELDSLELRDNIGFVPQTALLFKGTVRSNIQFGKKDATDDEIYEALSVAQAKNFIDKQPDKLDTFVSQSGKNFSGGQKQRLCIARALIKKPEIYIFDDSFSALDFKTDAKLRHALKGYTSDASVIVVAQRVSSILDADNIIVLNEGKIVGQGKHQELIKSCPEYVEIVKSQLDSDEIEKTISLEKEYISGGIK